MHLFAEALNIFFIAWAEFGLADAMRTIYVINVARNVSENNEDVYDFLVSFKNGILSMAKSNETHVEFTTVILHTSKKVCTAMASYFVFHLNMDQGQIEREIYLHGVYRFFPQLLKDILPDSWSASAVAVNLETNGDSAGRKAIYVLAWALPDRWD